jgi:hypothetical protein
MSVGRLNPSFSLQQIARPPPALDKGWQPLEGPPDHVETLVPVSIAMYVDEQGHRYEVTTFRDPDGKQYRHSNQGGQNLWFELVAKPV